MAESSSRSPGSRPSVWSVVVVPWAVVLSRPRSAWRFSVALVLIVVIKVMILRLILSRNLKGDQFRWYPAAMPATQPAIHATTILSVRRGNQVSLGGDGQVTLGHAVAKADAVKVRLLPDVGAEKAGVLVGFAGGAADAFGLLERFESKLKGAPMNLLRAASELARDWRSDRVLRRLEAMMVVADGERTLIVSGQGDLIEPSDGIAAVGSGGSYALAAARSLVAHTDLSASDTTREALAIAAGICIYTNESITVLDLGTP